MDKRDLLKLFQEWGAARTKENGRAGKLMFDIFDIL
jgi:hypothetical protein